MSGRRAPARHEDPASRLDFDSCRLLRRRRMTPILAILVIAGLALVPPAGAQDTTRSVAPEPPRGAAVPRISGSVMQDSSVRPTAAMTSSSTRSAERPVSSHPAPIPAAMNETDPHSRTRP